MEALETRATEFLENVELFFLLDAFRGHVDLERAGQRYDSRDNRFAPARPICGRLHKAAIDLDHRELDLLNIAQRRIAAAEIIQRKADTEVVETGKQSIELVIHFEQHALGHFKNQTFRRQPA